MDSTADGGEETSSSPRGSLSPVMERNPSPPPDSADGDLGGDVDAIGGTVYSKHWLFSTLTRLIQMVAQPLEEASESKTELTENEEEDLCRVWDMAMDEDVAGFLLEFKATDILLGVIAKSRCPRLTEICVGILGNMSCFPDTCLSLSQSEDLGVVLLLLFGDSDPPTLLETCRLVLACVSHKDVSPLWLQRIQQQPSVRSNLLFIMSSSTNTELLEKVGELIDKLFDLDEDLMKSWVGGPPPSEEGGEGESRLDLASCLLEAAKQLRSESPDGLEVYLHALHLLTTIDEGIQTFASPDGAGEALWDFVCEVVCEDLCQSRDLTVPLQEHKGLLVQTFSMLHALYRCQAWRSSRPHTALIGAILGVMEQQHREGGASSTCEEAAQDEQLQMLAEIISEFLADICLQISKETVADLVKEGYVSERTCRAAVECLLPDFTASLQQLQVLMCEAEPRLAEALRKPSSRASEPPACSP